MPLGAREYHERTKHSPRSIREGGHRLDFDNKPSPDKAYVDRPTVPLDRGLRPPQQPALAAIAESGPNGSRNAVDSPPALDRETLATLCYYAAGITKTIERRGRTLRFRAQATTGALYHVDLYVVCGELGSEPNGSGNGLDPDGADGYLPAGVYHFDPRTLSLDVLREGDHRAVLADSSDHDGVAEAPVTFAATSTWWRNAWKYAERTFRHAFWDSGTTLANLLAVAHALDYRAEVVTGFADRPVADLLGVDPEREAPLELVAIGEGDPVTIGEGDPAAGGDDPLAVEPIDPETAPLSPNEKAFPAIYEAWSAGVLESGEAAADWRADRPADAIGTRESGAGDRIPLDPVDHGTASKRPLHRTIRRRGSCREYTREPIGFRKLSTVLDRAFRGVPMDVRREGERSEPSEERAGAQRHASRESDPPLAFCDAYLLANGVEGLESGAYHYHPEGGDERGEGRGPGELERLFAGDVREEAGHLALDQRLGADAAVCVYFLSDLDEIVDAFGDRGYRVAQLEAALTAGRLYLATYAHRDLGGTGLTFYDDLVTDRFAPRADGQTPLFLYTMGRPA